MEKSYKRLSLCTIMVIVLLLFAGVAGAEGKWMIAKNTLSTGEGRPAGQPTEDSVCIWNPSYSQGETVEWFGGKKYSESLGSFVAHGEGRAVWYLYGEFEQSDEGNHFMGKRQGRVTQKFADGRTLVKDWQQTIEPVSITNISATGKVVAQAGQTVQEQQMTSSEVYALQNKLKGFGYYQGPLDSDFGKGTLAAVIRFQADCKLTANGVVDQGTLKALSTNKASSISSQLGPKIVALALQQKNKNYVWGGSSPETGFDCSGFTYYVLSQLGVTIERTADVQYHRQESISFKDLQAGDLVFFSNGDPEPTHVGIFIGNGKFIHANGNEMQGGSVKISDFKDRMSVSFMGGRHFR